MKKRSRSLEGSSRGCVGECVSVVQGSSLHKCILFKKDEEKKLRHQHSTKLWLITIFYQTTWTSIAASRLTVSTCTVPRSFKQSRNDGNWSFFPTMKSASERKTMYKEWIEQLQHYLGSKNPIGSNWYGNFRITPAAPIQWRPLFICWQLVTLQWNILNQAR